MVVSSFYLCVGACTPRDVVEGTEGQRLLLVVEIGDQIPETTMGSCCLVANHDSVWTDVCWISDDPSKDTIDTHNLLIVATSKMTVGTTNRFWINATLKTEKNGVSFKSARRPFRTAILVFAFFTVGVAFI